MVVNLWIYVEAGVVPSGFGLLQGFFPSAPSAGGAGGATAGAVPFAAAPAAKIHSKLFFQIIMPDIHKILVKFYKLY